MDGTPRRWHRPAPEPPRPLLDPPPPPYHRTSATSRAAAESMQDAAGTIECRILAYVRARGPAGASSEEVSTALDLRVQTCSGRCATMLKHGRLLDSGRTRPTSSGRAARVLIHPDFTPVTGGQGCSAHNK